MSLENAIWQKADCLYTLPFTDTVLLQLVDIVLSDRERLLRIMLNSQLALNMTQQECNRQNPKDRNPVSFPSRLYVLGCRGGNQSKSFQCHDSWQFRIGLAYI